MTRKSREKKKKTRRSNINNIHDVESSSSSSSSSSSEKMSQSESSRNSSKSQTPSPTEFSPYSYSNEVMVKKIDAAITQKLKQMYPDNPDIKSQLEELIVDSGSYSGKAIRISGIPAPFTLEEFSKLKKLILNGQKLEHEFDYKKMPPKLEYLEITKNKIPLEITNRIYLLKNLNTLHLESCKLKTLPHYLAYMKNLETVNLRDNELTEFPEGLGNPNLVELSISKNSIVEFPMKIIKKMRKLQILDMNFMNRSFEDQPEDALSPIFELKSLVVLNMDGLEGVKKIPENIGNLKELENLSLLGIGEQVTSLPRSIGNLRELKLLRITRSAIDALPSTIGKLKRLEKFTCIQSRLTTLPDEFCKLKSLQELDLGHGLLRELPTKIGDLKNLKLLHVYDNHISILPDSLCELHNLENLNMMANLLSGLPDCFGNLHKLKHLNMETNSIATLPASFSQLRELQYLYLNENVLVNLPEGFAELPAIITVSLYKNRLRNSARAILPRLLANPTLQNLFIYTNGIRFTAEDIAMIEAAENGPRRLDISYRNLNRHEPYANIILGEEEVVDNVAVMIPQENAMEVHREYDMINKDELISILGGLKHFPAEYLDLEPANENSFNTMLLSRLKTYLGYLPKKTESDKAEYAKIMTHLEEISEKLRLVDFTGNVVSLNIFYTAIEYVNRQPPEFQANYAYNYVLSNALAYCSTVTDRTSCALGMKERILMDLAAGSAGLDPEKIKDEYVEIAQIIQLDKIPATWTNIDHLQVKPSKIGAFASACVANKLHQKKMRMLHGLPLHRSEYRELKTDKEREEFKLRLRKEYVENCITRKIVSTFTNEGDRRRFKNASAPLVVKAYVEMPVIAEMLEDDAFPDLSHGGRRTRRRRVNDTDRKSRRNNN